MDTLLQTLWDTPWWVYVLFVYLVKIGYDASKTRVMPFNRLFILPTVFLCISIETLIYSALLNAYTITAYIVSLALGIAIGWKLVRDQNIRIDKNRSLIQIPGNWATLLTILVIFTAKYYFGYKLANDPKLAQDTSFEMAVLAVSGGCTGLFFGRLTCYLFRRKSDHHYTLST